MWEALGQIRNNEELANSLDEGNEKGRIRELVKKKKRGRRKWVDDDGKEGSPL